jgi:hypothetical protein
MKPCCFNPESIPPQPQNRLTIGICSGINNNPQIYSYTRFHEEYTANISQRLATRQQSQNKSSNIMTKSYLPIPSTTSRSLLSFDLVIPYAIGTADS